MDGPYRSEGILEVFVYSRWYTLCAESLSPTAINTVCYQLGYTGSIGNNNRYVCVCVYMYPCTVYIQTCFCIHV